MNGRRNYRAPRRAATSHATSLRVSGRKPDAAIFLLMARRSRPSFEMGRFFSLRSAPLREWLAMERLYSSLSGHRVAGSRQMHYHYPMQISVTIPDQLAAQAESRGVSVDAYVRELLEQAAVRDKTVPPRSSEEIEAFLIAMADGSESLPLLPTESFTRSSFYGFVGEASLG